MIDRHSFFRKTAERELKTIEDKRTKLIMKDFLAQLYKIIEEQDSYMQKQQKKKKHGLLLDLTLQLMGFAFGGIWLYVYQNNIIDFKIILITILFFSIIIIRYKL